MPYYVNQGDPWAALASTIGAINQARTQKQQFQQDEKMRQQELAAQIAANQARQQYDDILGQAAITRASTGQQNADTNRMNAQTKAKAEAEKERYDKSLDLFRAKQEALKQAQFEYAKTKDSRAFALKQQQINNAYNLGIQRISASITVAQIHAAASESVAQIHAAATVQAANIHNSGAMSRQQQREQFQLKHPGAGRQPSVTTTVQSAIQTLAQQGVAQPSDPNFGAVLELWAKHPLERSTIYKSDKVPAETKAYLKRLEQITH